jgi:hypothetical protein
MATSILKERKEPKSFRFQNGIVQKNLRKKANHKRKIDYPKRVQIIHNSGIIAPALRLLFRNPEE